PTPLGRPPPCDDHRVRPARHNPALRAEPLVRTRPCARDSPPSNSQPSGEPMTPETLPTFHDAYPAVLRRVLTSPDYDISTRGNVSAEVLDVSFRLANPRQRVPYLGARPINIAYNWAELLWYMSARSDVDMIGYYAPVMRTWAPD